MYGSAGGYIIQSWKVPEYVVPDLTDFEVSVHMHAAGFLQRTVLKAPLLVTP